MNLYLFSGFLGSGKTTMVVQLAKYLVDVKKAKVMLIVNDVGDVGIDAQLMRKLHTDVHELFGGCICGQLGNLINLLNGIGTKYDVEDVIIEASGIAQPARFLKTIRMLVPQEMVVQVVALADASRWPELTTVLPDLINSQIDSADLVIVNKVDIVNEEEKDAVYAYIQDRKPDVPMYPLCANDIEEVERLFEVIYNA